jgi:hypothetical protein
MCVRVRVQLLELHEHVLKNERMRVRVQCPDNTRTVNSSVSATSSEIEYVSVFE